MLKLIFTFLLRCEIRNAHQPLRADVRYFHIVMALPFLMCLYPITSEAQVQERVDSSIIAYILSQEKEIEAKQWPLAAKGDSCMKAFDYFHAMEYYGKMDELFISHHPSLLRNKAEIYRHLGQYYSWFDTMRRIEKDSVTYKDLRSLFFASRNIESEDYVSLYGDSILRINPYDSEIVVSMASFFNDTEHPDKAMELCYDYMQRDSTNLAVMRQYGYAAHLLGKSQEALETYKKLETKGFDNYESALIIGYSLLKLDSAWNARPYLRKAVEKRKGKEYSSYLHLGNANIACGEYREGIDNLEKVINIITPENELYYSLYNSIGEAFYNQLKYEDAAKAFLECTKYKSDNPLVYYNIAQMCKGMKDAKREMKYSQKFLDISHHLQDTEENKELIKQAEERLEELKKELRK